MKRLVVTLAVLFWMGVWAQGSSVEEFRQSFAYGLRVAEMPCPEEVAPVFPEAVCYHHGYGDFFDFKEAVGPYMVEPGGDLEPWRVITMNVEGERVKMFQTRYRPRGNPSRITLTYVSEGLLVLGSEVRASP